MDLRKLTMDVQGLLSASSRINSYKRAVEELVYNSLDAESTCIAIRIHIQNSWIQVIDNGCGIKKTDYNLLGHRYATSKMIDINTLKAVPSKYGYQGQALANIIQVSQAVKIISRCTTENDTWVKTFREGRKDEKCFKAPMRPSKGTTVEINGFLYNLKIQKKRINAFNELQDIKAFLEQLLLIFNNVSISLRDDSENEIILKMHKTRDISQTLKSLFDIDTNDVKELQVEKNKYKVKAFIGTVRKNTKNCHWVYLNNKFVQVSNLNSLIAEKFINPNRMKPTKNKYMEACNEENSDLSKFVPFYFLFITCPYYEYDIVNSGKQTAIEFKDWIQINNLIGKLVTIYNCDKNVINEQKFDYPNQVSKKDRDTRNEVKKIMEKILGRPNKTSKVSQMKNGIKGKRVKRRIKKQQANISLTNIKPPRGSDVQNRGSGSIDPIKLSKHGVVEDHYVKPKYCKSNIMKQEINYQTNSNLKASKKNPKKSKRFLKCNCKKSNNYYLVDIFKNNIHSVKRRCNELSCDTKHLLKFKNTGEIKSTSSTKMINISPVVNTDSKQENHIIKESKISTKTTSPRITDIKCFSNNWKLATKKIRSYDLLQTIIKTQTNCYDQEARKEATFISITKSNFQPESYRKYYCAPKLTFNSHKNNINKNFMRKELAQNVQFCSKQSTDNYKIGADKNKRSIQIKTGEIAKHRSSFYENSKRKLDIIKYNRPLKKNKHDNLETPSSIDKSETDIVEFSKKIRNQVMTDMNSLCDNRDCDKIYRPNKQPDYIEQIKYGVNLNIERTYTVLVDSYNNSNRAFNIHQDRRTIIDETISHTNVSYHNTIYNNHAYETSNAIFMSEPQHSPEMNVYEPVHLCEAIINSPENVEYDMDLNIFSRRHSPNNIKNETSILHNSSVIKELLNNDSSKKLWIDTANNKSLPRKDSPAHKYVKENEGKNESVTLHNSLLDQNNYEQEKIYPNNSEMIQDNSIHNFKLNPRHRFVPKGMSQIFKNCFSKNICSYNLDTEYYDNTIYNNFAEEIVVNSEMFEPKVQNLREFTTGDIQKISEKLKKLNADLVFGTDSLRSAKVLGQVDCKFIAAIIQDVTQGYKSSEFLVFFDQHAVHERISLERNLSYYYGDENWKKVAIDTISLKASKDEILYLHNHKDKFTRFGLEWIVLDNYEILVNAIPEAIKGKNPRPLETIARTVKDLISEQMYALKHLKGNVSLYPQSIMNLVFSEACRYAIKFGDKLSMRDCVELIAALATCKTPFQCAHGRPVMAVMIELNNEKIEYKANMENIMKFMNRINK